MGNNGNKIRNYTLYICIVFLIGVISVFMGVMGYNTYLVKPIYSAEYKGMKVEEVIAQQEIEAIILGIVIGLVVMLLLIVIFRMIKDIYTGSVYGIEKDNK